MVDIIKLPFFEQISVPKFYSYTPRNDQLNNKQWVGRCLGDPPRKLNLSELPKLHRNMIDQEMSRCYSITIDTSTTMKIKPQQQRNNKREPLKVTTVTSNSILSNIDETDSRLFETLSKHFTIKAEPLRPVNNNFLNNSTNTQSSWQKYWSSANNPPQERKETNDFHLPPIRSKRSRSNVTTARDSSTRNTASTSTPTISDRPSSATREDCPLMDSSKSSLPIDGEGTDEINTLTSKIYKLPLPSNHSKPNKSILKKRSKSLERKPMIPSKLIEKKETKPTASVSNTLVPKRKTPPNRLLTKKQQQSLSTVITTTPRSKYGPQRWDEPYVGTRFDPPTPPSSPSYFPWSQVNDQYENEIPYKLNYIDEIYF